MLITRPFAYNESLQHPTIAGLLNYKIKILIFFDHSVRSVYLFQSNQRFQAIEFVDRHVSEKALNLFFLKLSSGKTYVASITQRFLFPVSTVSARNAWHNDLPFVS